MSQHNLDTQRGFAANVRLVVKIAAAFPKLTATLYAVVLASFLIALFDAISVRPVYFLIVYVSVSLVFLYAKIVFIGMLYRLIYRGRFPGSFLLCALLSAIILTCGVILAFGAIGIAQPLVVSHIAQVIAIVFFATFVFSLFAFLLGELIFRRSDGNTTIPGTRDNSGGA